jgi:hypothetical protein
MILALRICGLLIVAGATFSTGDFIVVAGDAF